MIRSSVRRTLPLLGVLGATLALTACGSQAPRPGAAALVGSDRITVAAVEARVGEFRAQADRLPPGQYQEQTGLVGATVSEMVFDQVVAHALADHGLTVTDAEVARERGQEAAALGGEPALQQTLLLKHVVPASDVDAFFREQIGLSKLAALNGQQLGTADGNRTVHQLLTEASDRLRVTVNPRYGSWDPAQAVLDAPSEPWLPQSGAAA